LKEQFLASIIWFLLAVAGLRAGAPLLTPWPSSLGEMNTMPSRTTRVLTALACILTLTGAPGAAADPLPIIYPEGTSANLIILDIAQKHGYFAKRGLEIALTPIMGAEIPRLDSRRPMGLIGTPAAILQAVEGNDLRIVASFSSSNLSGHLVARPEVKAASDLRGKKVGVRVVGAGIWITTMLALQHVGLDPKQDNITAVPVGSPTQIVRALEDGAVDAALVPVPVSRDLKAKGFTVLMENAPADSAAFETALVVAVPHLRENTDKVAGVIAALTEATAFALAEQNKAQVLESVASFLKIENPAAAEAAYRRLRELKSKPYPSLQTLRTSQRVMALHDPRVLNQDPQALVDDNLVRKLD
jgi:ABC-type nitrate/sulfonate/bicarbonate transport system substrate-binding protein